MAPPPEESLELEVSCKKKEDGKDVWTPKDSIRRPDVKKDRALAKGIETS